MELLFCIVTVVTALLVFIIIRSSKSQEGYKRWKAGSYVSDTPYARKENKCFVFQKSFW